MTKDQFRDIDLELLTTRPPRDIDLNDPLSPAIIKAKSTEPIEIPIDLIKDNPFQTRDKIDVKDAKMKSLANSIRKLGLINPISVIPDSNGPGYILLAGERRLTAHRMLGKTVITAIVRKDITTDDLKAWAITFSENAERQQLKPLEASEAIDIAKNKMKVKTEEIADILGVTKRRVNQLHGTLDLPADLVEKLQSAGKLTHRHIQAFKKLLSNNKVKEMTVLEDDVPEIIKTKNLIFEFYQEVINEDMDGNTALTRAAHKLSTGHKTTKIYLSQAKRELFKAGKKSVKYSSEMTNFEIKTIKEMLEELNRLLKVAEARLNETRTNQK